MVEYFQSQETVQCSCRTSIFSKQMHFEQWRSLCFKIQCIAAASRRCRWHRHKCIILCLFVCIKPEWYFFLVDYFRCYRCQRHPFCKSIAKNRIHFPMFYTSLTSFYSLCTLYICLWRKIGSIFFRDKHKCTRQ